MMGRRPPQDPAAVARGKQVFVTNCAFCHGSAATGGEGGPDLVRSILVLHDEKGNNIGPVVLNGRPGKGMPKFTLTQDQISDIAAFLHAQAEAKANRRDYKIQNVVTGDPKAGQAYFDRHCASCHSVTGDLAGVAKKYEPEALQSRFLYPKTFRSPGMPDAGPKPVPTKVTVTLPSGESISGTLEHMDDFNVAMYDSQGVYHSWLRSRNPGLQVQVADPLEVHVQLLQQYTNSDMHNILAYLETLK
jgi:cytochrome c oxidase cbb3-type subunit III